MPLATTKFDVQAYLGTPDERAAYVEAALETNDPGFIAMALGDIARARGVTEFARETGVSRETIYKAFVAGGNPTLETVWKVATALGLRLSVVPIEAAPEPN
jgi:probable addiction module antidote protein